MNKKEKALLLYVVLKDIRSNYADHVWERLGLAKSLCNELNGETKEECWNKMQKSIDEFGELHMNGDTDGRYFREELPKGYINMEKTFEPLKETYHDKSEEFQKRAKIITYPEFAFLDCYDNFGYRK